ncbi:LysR family transcriptional regulator [Pseudomonas tolaasii]
MNITIRHLRVALAVERSRSFRKAAEELCVTQPALSIAISDLEKDLGLTLFDRTSRYVNVTELGQDFLRRAERIVEDFQSLIRDTVDISRSHRGLVKISCTASVAGRMMPLVLRECQEKYPDVNIVIRDDPISLTVNALQAGEVDFGITVASANLGQDIQTEHLLNDRYFVVLHRSDPLADRPEIVWDNLNGMNYVAFTPASGTQRVVDEALDAQRVKFNQRIVVQQLATVTYMLEAGMGVSILPKLAIPHPEHPRLIAIPLTSPILEREVVLAYRGDRSFSPAAAAARSIVEDIASFLSD